MTVHLLVPFGFIAAQGEFKANAIRRKSKTIGSPRLKNPSFCSEAEI
jgi:hypothetical protein